MLFDVNIFDPKGNLLRTINSNKLRKRHWKIFLRMEKSKSFVGFDQQDVPGWLKKKMEMVYSER